MRAAATPRLQGREWRGPGSPVPQAQRYTKYVGVWRQYGPDSGKSYLSSKPEGAR